VRREDEYTAKAVIYIKVHRRESVAKAHAAADVDFLEAALFCLLLSFVSFGGGGSTATYFSKSRGNGSDTSANIFAALSNSLRSTPMDLLSTMRPRSCVVSNGSSMQIRWRSVPDLLFQPLLVLEKYPLC